MAKATNIVDGGLILASGAVSLANIESILSIILIVIDTIWIIGKVVIKFMIYYRDHTIDDEEANDLLNDVDNIKNIGGNNVKDKK